MPEIEKKIALCVIVGFSLVMLGISAIFYLKSPKEINSIYGYLTPRSMKNIANCNFANKLSAAYMLILSHVNLGISMLLFFLWKEKNTLTTLVLSITFLYCLSLILFITMVQTKLRRF